MEQNTQIGMRVRELRIQKEYTEEQMAQILGISCEDYRAYESGEKNAPFAIYYALAEKFGVDVATLMSGETPNLKRYTITRSGEGYPYIRRPDFTYLHQAFHIKDRVGEPFIVTIPYLGEENNLHYSEHQGQEFLLILKGSMKIWIDDREEILNEGDNVYLAGGTKHAMAAWGGESCKVLSFVMHSNEKEVREDKFAQIPVEKKLPATSNGKLLYQEFMTEEFAEDGSIKDVHFHVPDNFNFAYDVVDRLALKCPDKIAMRFVSNEKVCHDYTFADVSENSSRIANMLLSIGVRKGDRVMLVLKRHYQFWFILNALHKIGAVAVLAACQMTAHDYEYRIQRAHVKFAICSAEERVTGEVDTAEKNCGVSMVKMTVNGTREGWLNFDAMYPNFSPVFERMADLKITDPLLMFFSSGTTGYPKMVLHDHSYPLGHIMTARYWHNVNPDGFHFTVADTGWAKALWGKIYGQWLCEAGVFIYDFERFHASDLLPMFKQYGITTFCAPPTIFRFLVKEDLSDVDFSTIEHVSTAGEAMPSEVSEGFARISGRLPHEGFGQSESTLMIGTLANVKPRPGSMGKVNPQYKIDLLDHDGKVVPMGETGEICVKGTPENHPYGLFCRYEDAPEDNAKAWHDGYYHTGDLAWQDEDGYYWYVGRDDDIIKTSGYRVGPFEIESVMMELPYILECAVTGVPDPVRGKVVKATIVLVKGKEPSDALKEEIQEYVKTHTAPYKYPRVVEFVTELPKTVSGKIRRAAIRQQDGEKK